MDNEFSTLYFQSKNKQMKWYNHLAGFGAGFFLANVMPHMVNGVSGSEFPTPFATPSGVGLSSPITNVIWALINLLLAYILIRVSKIKFDNIIGMAVIFVGIGLCAFMCAKNFGANPNL